MAFIFLQQEAVEEHLSLKREKDKEDVRKCVEQKKICLNVKKNCGSKTASSSGLYPGWFCWDMSSGRVYILQVEAGPL